LAKTKRRGPTGTTPGRAAKSKGITPVQIGLVALAAILIVGGLIVLGNQARGGGGAASEADLAQYPTLGPSDASVTMIEFSDYG